MTLQVKADAFLELVDEGAELEQLGTGFTFTEGPLWNPEGFLLFSDMPGDVRRRWDEQGGVREVANPSNKGNGMTFDLDGRLIVCEHVTSSVVRMDPDGTGSGREVLATHFEGQELNSPNDVVVKSDGAIYFTDPTYGRMPGFGIEREQDLELPGRLPPPAGRRRPAAARSTTSASPTACASPPTSACSTSTTPSARTSARSTSATTARSATAASWPTGIGSGDLAVGDLVDGMKLDERGNIWVTGPGRRRARSGCASSAPRASTWAPSRCPRPWATSTGAVPTGAGCSSPRRRRCTACSARSRATASPT